MVPLEVTHTALATPAVCSEIKALGTPFADMILDLIHFFTVRKRPPLLPTGAALHSPSPPHPLPYGLRRCPSRATKWRARDRSIQETYRTIFGFASPPVHDVCAVALVAQPHLFTTQLMRVDVGASHSAVRRSPGRRQEALWGSPGLRTSATISAGGEVCECRVQERVVLGADGVRCVGVQQEAEERARSTVDGRRWLLEALFQSCAPSKQPEPALRPCPTSRSSERCCKSRCGSAEGEGGRRSRRKACCCCCCCCCGEGCAGSEEGRLCDVLELTTCRIGP